MRKSRLDDISYYPSLRVPVSSLLPYSYVGVEHLVKDRGGVCLSPDMPNADSAIQFRPGDILLGNIRPYLKKIWLADITGGASGDVIVVRIRDEYKDSITPDYLYKVLSSDQFFAYDNLNTKGAKMPRGDKKSIAAYLIPIPSIGEQKSIVDELDLLTSIIDKKNAQLRDLDALAQSIFYEMFGDPSLNEKDWPVKNISDLFDVGSSKRVFESEWRDSGVPFYRAREIVRLSKGLPLEDPIFIEEALFASYQRKYGIPTAGDIMVTGVGTLGVCYLVKEGDRFYFKDGNTLWFKDKHVANSRFIKDQYSTDFVKDQIKGNSRGATVGTYTIVNAKKTRVICPPVELQNEYVKRVQVIDAQKQLIEKSLSDTQNLLDSRMHNYFD